MAEAAVDMTTNMSQIRYFCHQCSQETSSVLPVSLILILINFYFYFYLFIYLFNRYFNSNLINN
jgi:hypothetical protein